MNTILKRLALIAIWIFIGNEIAHSQNIVLNVLTMRNEVKVGDEGLIQITVNNPDIDRSAAVGQLAVSFSLNIDEETILGFYEGGEPEDWAIIGGGDDWFETSEHWTIMRNDGETFTAKNNIPLGPRAEERFYVRYIGVAPGTQAYVANIMWLGPQTPGNLPGDDQSSGEVTIIERQLPITLISFDAVRSGDDVDLSWSTATESNNAGFDVQRSADGQNWQIVGHVNSKGNNGNSTTKLNYQLTDNDPVSGINYYRLLQTDLDGKNSLSEVRIVSFDDRPGAVSIYPNPVRTSAVVRGLTGSETLRVFDGGGKLVINERANGNRTELNFSNLARGTYRVQVISAEGRLINTLSVVKAR